jgi:integrase
MPRRASGPRLHLEAAERDSAGRTVRHASWIVRDGKRKVRTGCRAEEAARAELFLANYIAEKHKPARERDREPSQIHVADVLSVYAEDVAGAHARPKESLARLRRLNEYFGAMRMSEVTGSRCRAYAEARKAPGAARRELEDLRAAVRHYRTEGYVSATVGVRLPECGLPRERWLRRDEAARLLGAAWRLRQDWQGHQTKRHTGRHVARFILIALYTGTRAGAVCSAAIRPTLGRPYVDLTSGIFYRRPPGTRETKKRTPPVPLPDRLLAHIRRWERKGIATRTLVEWQGQPVTRINKAFRAVRQAAGFGADVVPHTLRHTSATWLMQAGCDPGIAAGFLGMSVETLIRVYGHHSPAHLEAARKAIGKRPDNRPGHRRAL